MTQTQKPQKLLIPVKNGEDAGHAVAYAIRRRATGVSVAVYLLHVEESGTAGEGSKAARDVVWHDDLKNGRQAAGRSRPRPRPFDAALQLLLGLDIHVAVCIRRGDVAFAILDAAEELDCQEIVMPAPPVGLSRWLSRNVVDSVLNRQRTVQVVAVNRDGTLYRGKDRKNHNHAPPAQCARSEVGQQAG